MDNQEDQCRLHTRGIGVTSPDLRLIFYRGVNGWEEGGARRGVGDAGWLLEIYVLATCKVCVILLPSGNMNCF